MKVVQFNPITGNRFFTGQSDQEKASQSLYSEVANVDPNVKNRFDTYNDPFSYGDVSKNVNEAFGSAKDAIEKDTADQAAKSQAGAAASMASRGITGGSALTDTQSGIAEKLNTSKSSALSRLGSAKASSLGDIMKYFNQLGLAKTQGAQNVDLANMSNLFQKLGLEGGAIGGLSDETWLDDALAGLDTAANLTTGIAGIPGI